MVIHANDGISESGKNALEKEGFTVLTTRVASEQLIPYLQQHRVNALLVRSATSVTREIITACPALKLIGRGGVGMDNIDVDFAKSKGIHVINTPEASADSVAELVFAHLLGGVRFLHDSNRNMPLEGDQHFKSLKKTYSKGSELKGKTLGIIGFGRIGKAVAKIGIGMGMQVIFSDAHQEQCAITLEFYDGQQLDFNLKGYSLDKLLQKSDFVSLHVPAQDSPIIGKRELGLMKEGAALINAARGGVVDEVALLDALESEKISFAGLDVFESEPRPEVQLLMHPKLSLSPHIGAATREAQDRIGLELAEQIINLLK
ncbi:D-2-hydroxyacid dehydrogenase [Robiginitalea sp. IMCC44478]|uniref:D-2-hydroxyacid dehydrogenase n=1 Tax=Robiginitalea sp. IMCC44478 TaxID=3459122 RepID=UPI0040420DEF